MLLLVWRRMTFFGASPLGRRSLWRVGVWDHRLLHRPDAALLVPLRRIRLDSSRRRPAWIVILAHLLYLWKRALGPDHWPIAKSLKDLLGSDVAVARKEAGVIEHVNDIIRDLTSRG